MFVTNIDLNTDLKKTDSIMLQNYKEIKLSVWKTNLNLQKELFCNRIAADNININTYKLTLKDLLSMLAKFEKVLKYQGMTNVESMLYYLKRSSLELFLCSSLKCHFE